MANRREEIVEERIWRAGVEMVSRVNWSQIARVRRSLGVVADESGRSGIFDLAASQRTSSGLPAHPADRPVGSAGPRSATGPRHTAVSLRIRQTGFGSEHRTETGSGTTRRSA